MMGFPALNCFCQHFVYEMLSRQNEMIPDHISGLVAPYQSTGYEIVGSQVICT